MIYFVSFATFCVVLILIGVVAGMFDRSLRWLLHAARRRLTPRRGEPREASPAPRAALAVTAALLALVAGGVLASFAEASEEDCRRAGIDATVGGIALILPVEAVETGDVAAAGLWLPPRKACAVALRRAPPLAVAAVTFQPFKQAWRCGGNPFGPAGLVCALGRGALRIESARLTIAALRAPDADGEALRDLTCRREPAGRAPALRCEAEAAFAALSIRYVFHGDGDDASAPLRAAALHRDFLKLLAFNLAARPAAPPASESR